MASAGLWMLVVLAVLTVGTGLPVWALLVGVAWVAAAIGIAAGAFDSGVLSAAGPRVLSLLEHDLLQAMPLYVFVGLLLQRLPLADAVFGACARAAHRTRAGASLAALGTGAMVAPLNGSVASSSALLARLVAPRLGGVPPARAIALVSAASTIGVVVPPSLVLILLGDAMMRAHTEATQLPGSTLGGQRIVNTQDVLHAALLPALGVLALWLALAWWQGRGRQRDPEPPRHARQLPMALATVAFIGLLLTAVFQGWLFAVEAAAGAGVLLIAGTLATRSLDAAAWQQLLAEVLALSGALFALLAGATTFSLVFRLFGTDRWLAGWIAQSPWPGLPTTLLILAGVAACAAVLDAFEMIFVIVPIAGPLLVARLGDAQQTAVLLMLVLQFSFLLPPMGYAVIMARTRSGLPPVPTVHLVRALLPYAAAQLLVMALVLWQPAAVHTLDGPAPTPQAAPTAKSEAELERQMREMSPQAEPEPEPEAGSKTPAR